MKCVQCNEETRLISDSSTYVGAIPFRDSKGIIHVHDDNKIIRVYKCDNNHIVDNVSYGTCWCGWSGRSQ